MDSDNELFIKIQRGDSSAVEAVITGWHPLFTGFLSKMINPEDARDIAQDSYLAMIRHFHTFNNLTHAKRFLYKAGYRKAIDFLRKTGRHRDSMIHLKESVVAGSNQSDRNSDDIHTDDLLAAVNALPAKEKAVVLLKISQDLSYHEIASHLGIPIGTALYRMHCAVKRIRKMFADNSDVHGRATP